MYFKGTLSAVALSFCAFGSTIAQSDDSIPGRFNTMIGYADVSKDLGCALPLDDSDGIDVTASDYVFLPTITLDNGIKIGRVLNLNEPPVNPFPKIPLFTISPDFRTILLIPAVGPGVPCDGIAKAVLERLLKRLEGDEEAAKDHLRDRRMGLIEAQDFLIDGSPGWRTLQGMINLVDEQLVRFGQAPDNPEDTYTGLKINVRFDAYGLGALTDPKLGATQRTSEDYKFGGAVSLTRDIAIYDDLRIFAGGRGFMHRIENDRLLNIGGISSPIGEGNSIKGAGFVVGGHYHFTELFAVRSYGGLGFATQNYNISQNGVTVAGADWISPAFMFGVGAYYYFCTCAYLGLTADYMYLPSDTIYLNNGVPLERGGQNLWMFGASMIIPFAIGNY